MLNETSKLLFIGLIEIYQWTISPDHGVFSIYTFGKCKFRPTCSEYTKNMIQEHGAIQGSKKGLNQIRKCH
ncbi:MAG: membrane protein insertion efficiency factor YidD [Candidatus Spechtbacterales bacterium]